jgi:hypothetical protein
MFALVREHAIFTPTGESTMTMPGFSAEASLGHLHTRDSAAPGDGPVHAGTVVPQFCYCDCRLRRICLPIGGIWHCFYLRYCIPHGNCPPGYCQSGF